MVMTAKVEMSGSNKTIHKDPMLILDLVILVMERLSFVDFHRARCVSSVWYSASKSCRTRQANPWIVLFPTDEVLHLPLESIEDSCKLFDPVDRKSYTVRDLGSDILRTSCLASYNSWFLMLDRKTRFYLLNMLTRERIHLPCPDSMESNDGSKLKFKRNFDSSFTVTTFRYKETLLKTCYGIQAAVLWVDDRNKDYLVVWAFHDSIAYHKKGDDSWRVFQSSTESYNEPTHLDHLVVATLTTLSGQVLVISKFKKVLVISRDSRRSLNIYKKDPKSSEWSTIESLRNEDGVLKNCDIQTMNEVQLFNHLIASSSLPFKDARWFVPTFGGK